MMLEEDEDDPVLDEDLIPGDNSKQSEEKWPNHPDAPSNLTQVPADVTPTSKDLGGD